MIKLKNKYAIGCLVQWYEVEIFEEYIESLKLALQNIENKENVMVDICFNISQNLEKIDESQMTMYDVFHRFLKTRDSLAEANISYKINFYPTSIQNINDKNIKPISIADYRREFNEKYCEEVDVLMWGETDAILPSQTFEILDNLHNEVKDKTPKYVTFFGICKMWDDSWKVLEHPDFTDKPFIDNDYENWWSLKYTMSREEMEKINNKVTELDIRVLDQHKFNGCGLVISSEVIKSGVNIPRSVFFVHEDTAFMLMIQKVLGMIPQYVIKNILLVHNRNHPKKRMYIDGERDDGTMNEKRRSNNWYVNANKMSEHNTYNLFNQTKTYSWKDVFDES
jgi:hypothetical protein